MQMPVEVLSPEDVEQLLAHPNVQDMLGLRDAALLATLYYAAATSGQVAAFNLSDLQVRRRQIVLRTDDGGTRTVQLADPLADLLERYKRDSRRLILAHGGSSEQQSKALFLGNRAQRIRVQDVRQILGTNVKAAGIKATVNLNTLRLSRAWHLRQEGMSPESIQRFLGATSRSGRPVI